MDQPKCPSRRCNTAYGKRHVRARSQLACGFSTKHRSWFVLTVGSIVELGCLRYVRTYVRTVCVRVRAPIAASTEPLRQLQLGLTIVRRWSRTTRSRTRDAPHNEGARFRLSVGPRMRDAVRCRERSAPFQDGCQDEARVGHVRPSSFNLIIRLTCPLVRRSPRPNIFLFGSPPPPGSSFSPQMLSPEHPIPSLALASPFV